MVSELSARLNYSSGYSSSGSDATPSSSDVPDACRSQKREYASSQHEGSSGYMADVSATFTSTADSAVSRSSPPFPPSIELLLRNAKKTGRPISHSGQSSDTVSSTAESDDQITHPCFKRHKTMSSAEMNYRVRTVKQDMEKGGLVYQRQSARRPHIFPPKSFVDMSTVSLVIADKNTKFPFSLPKTDSNYHTYVDCPLQLASLIQATSSHYSPKFNEPLPPAFSAAVNNLLRETAILEEAEKESSSDGDSESTMSSFTVSDGGAAQPSWPSNNTTTCNKEQRASLPTTRESAVMPISEALSISRHPRIITLAQAPFNVVQVNAAFLRMVNSTSTAEYLGRPLRDLTVDTSVISSLQESLATLQAVVVPGEQHFHQTKDRRHKISIFPVGTPGQDVKVTHFAVKLRPRTCSDRSVSCSSVSSSATSFSHCKTDSTPVFAMG